MTVLRSKSCGGSEEDEEDASLEDFIDTVEVGRL